MVAPFQMLFTDLDGTLLDERTYAFDAALPALQALQSRRITTVPCTSKTFAETVDLLEVLGLTGPCIVENGGAIYFPPGGAAGEAAPLVRCGGWDRLDLGAAYGLVVEELARLEAETGIPVRGFSRMEPPEIAEACGLSLQAAERCKAREFDEPFRLREAIPGGLERLAARAEARGFTVTTGGRFHHLSKGSDKGRAVRVVRGRLAPVGTVGVGDSLNDLPMLEAVDLPILVMRPGGQHHGDLLARLPQAIRAPGIGPVGWNLAVLELLTGEAADDS